MKYRIEGIDGEHECAIVGKSGSGEYVVNIGGREHELRIVSADSRGVDFALGSSRHRAVYVEGGALETRMILDGVEMTVVRHTGLDEIVYKNSGGRSEAGAGKDALASPIPGKVISVAVGEGDEIAKDDQICVLEAMKMQVTVKAHKSGTVKSLGVKTGDTIAKGFAIAEIS